MFSYIYRGIFLSSLVAINAFSLDFFELETFKSRLAMLNEQARLSDDIPMSSLDRENGRDIAREYYAYLQSNRVAYAEAALKVINNAGYFGKIANLQLRTQAVFDGIEREYLPELQDRIVIRLAFCDVERRISQGEEFSFKTISNYHKDVFKEQGLTEYACGGLAIEELAGSGSYMTLVELSPNGLLTFFKAIHENLEHTTTFSRYRLLGSIRHSLFCLLFEHDYLPMVRATNPEQAALWFGVDESRVEEIEGINSDLFDAVLDAPLYKILPKNPKKSAGIDLKARSNRALD